MLTITQMSVKQTHFWLLPLHLRDDQGTSLIKEHIISVRVT